MNLNDSEIRVLIQLLDELLDFAYRLGDSVNEDTHFWDIPENRKLVADICGTFGEVSPVQKNV